MKKNIFISEKPKINITQHLNSNIHITNNFNIKKINWYFYHLFLFDKSLNNKKIKYHVFLKNNTLKNKINDIIYMAPPDFHIIYFDCFNKNNNDSKYIKTNGQKYKYGYIINYRAFNDLKEFILKNKITNWENILADYSKLFPVYSYNNSPYLEIKQYSLTTKYYKNNNNIEIFNLPLFWINMNNSIFRRIFFQTFISPFFKNNKRIEGHDSNIDPNYKKYSNISSPGQWGCLQSHYKISEFIYTHKIKKAAIMEDDIFINFKYFVENTIKFNKVPNDWDILQLVTSNIVKYKSFKKRTWKHWDSRYWCTAFYIINYNGANKIYNSPSFSLTEDSRLVADFHLYENTNTFTYCKPLVNFNSHNYSIIDDNINVIEKKAIKYINELYKLV